MKFPLSKLRYIAGLMLASSMLAGTAVYAAEARPTFSADDVFELEWARDPSISPDGSQVLWVRSGFDRMSDKARGTLWLTDVETGLSEPLLGGDGNYSNASFSPSGDRVLYLLDKDGDKELRVRWLSSGRDARVALLENGPKQMTWSPDGKLIAFTMLTPEARLDLSRPTPRKPGNADWADPVKVIDDLVFRFDGRGYLKKGEDQVYVVPAHGGTPRALTSGGSGYS
jgi:acylaminoacyl-peptidase